MPELQSTIIKNSSNLKGYWRMEGSSTDSSGNANNGTDTAVTYNASYGKFGQGALFNGTTTTGTKIVVGTSATLDFASAFSIGGWIKLSTTPNDTAMISKIGGANLGYMIYFGADTKPIIYINNASRVTAATALGTTDYNHVVAVWTGTVLYLYINGKMDASAAYSTAPTSSGQTFQIGTWSSSGNRLPANLDDLFAYDIALSADQIKELYEGRYIGEGWPQTGLVAGYHLNGNSTDFSGNNNHGADTAITYSLANGKLSQGAGFNGSSSKIVVPSTALAGSLGTLSGWIKLNSTSSYQTIASRWQDGFNYLLFSVNGGKLEIESFRGSGNNYKVQGGSTLTTGIWYYVVVTSDGSNWKLYVNGAPETLTFSGTQVSYNGDWFADVVGTNYTLGLVLSSFMSGALDEVQVYNVAKDARWIRQQFAWGSGKFL